MPRRVALLLPLLFAGCIDADVVEVDAGADTGAEPDAGLDAGPGDAGVDAGSDAGRPFLLFDDFDDGVFGWSSFDGPGGTWLIDHQDDGSWLERSGVLESRAADGAWWDDPACPGGMGPGLIHSEPGFPVGDGELTIEFDVNYGAGFSSCNASGWVALNDAAAVTEWDPTARRVTPEGSFARVTVTDSSNNVSVRLGDPSGPSNRHPVDVTTGRWYHMQVSLCGELGYHLRFGERGAGAPTVDVWNRVDATVPAAFTELHVNVMAEGPDKLFDNIEVRRGGCD